MPAGNMLDRTDARFEWKPKHLIGDTAYGTGPMIAWQLEEKQIEPHAPVWDKSERADGTFTRLEFNFEAELAGEETESIQLSGQSVRLSGLTVEVSMPPKCPSSLHHSQSVRGRSETYDRPEKAARQVRYDDSERVFGASIVLE